MRSARYISAVFIFSLCVSASTFGREAKAIPGRIVVKFRQNSLTAMKWSGSGRTGEIPFLKKILGEHSSRPYVSDNVLKAVTLRLNELNPRRTRAYSVTAELSRICIIDFSTPIDVPAVITKLRSEPQVEYAELSYERGISEIPNDPQFARQYYLQQIRVFDAWDMLPSGFKRPIVAIVDTGIDYLHEDLKENIFVNPGETGTDQQGWDKQTNGVDDDGNGFTDDWHGWDFTAKGTLTEQDNDPKPGHKHGTHVAGLAGAVTNNFTGIASSGRFVEILPVKVGPDDPNSLSVYNSYEGIAYAAAMGANIINCSWGGPGSSEAEQEITSAAMEMGSLIVAAAGNDDAESGFYPAAYPGVLSVASVTAEDEKSGFSNYHRTVDISSPGSEIYSTVPNNNYEYMSGTSMASPVAAGVAALVVMKFPGYSPLQIGAQLEATADTIDHKQNSIYRGRLGSGRVNALRAVTETEARSALLTEVIIEDANKDSIFEAGEQLQLFITVHNVLAPVKNARIVVTSVTPISPIFIQQSAVVGDMATNEIRGASSAITFTIPQDVPFNYVFELSVLITDDMGNISREIIAVTVRPTYRTFAANNITVTFNSEGNIGFNDYPENTQGKGFLYKGSANLLYEGAFMAGRSAGAAQFRLSNAARNINQIERDRSFHPVKVLGISKPGILAVEEGETVFADNNEPSEEAGISVRQKIYQFNEPGREDFVITSYDIVNTSGVDFENFYAGLFFDWDIGPSGQNNQARFSDDYGFGYVLNVLDPALPWTGVQVLSHQPNYYAIDNDGTSGSINIYDGFSRQEKWEALSNGRSRRQSGIGDVSFVIGAGPIRLKRGDTTRVAFSLMAASSFNGLLTARENALKTTSALGIDTVAYKPTPDETRIISVSPNPVLPTDGNIIIRYSLSEDTQVELRIVDILGKTVVELENGFLNATDDIRADFDTGILAQGQYFVQLVTSSGAYTAPFIVLQ